MTNTRTTPDPCKRMTFGEFKASGVDTPDLRTVQPDSFPVDIFSSPMPARTYAGPLGLYIQHDADGCCSVDLAGSCLSGTLAECEMDLYACYASECTNDDVRAALLDAVPANRYVKRWPDTEDSLCDLFTSWCTLQGLQPASADEMLLGEITPQQREWLTAFVRRWDAVMDAADASGVVGRGERVNAVIAAYAKAAGLVPDARNKETAARILLDVRHWCDDVGINFDEADAMSFSQYRRDQGKGGKA